MNDHQFQRLPTTLDPDQERAAGAPERFVLITGVPGSGRTYTLVETIASLLKNGATPDQIRSLACTTHGKLDLEDRLELNPVTREVLSEIMVAPFPELALNILHTPGVDIPGAPRGFTLWDRRQADQAFEDLIAAHFDPAPQPQAIRRAIAWAHLNRERHADEPLPPEERWWLEAVELVSHRKRQDGVLAYDDLVPAAISAMKSVPGVADRHRNQRDVHWGVDDFQEITPAQYDLLMLGLGPEGSITVSYNADGAVGVSPGASPAMLDQFVLEAGPRGPGVHVLSTNHRNSPPLGKIANRLAPQRSAGDTRPDGGAIPRRARPRLTAVEGRPVDQYARVLTDARWLHEQYGRPWEEMAVLYNRSAAFDGIRTMAIARGIPHTVLGGDGFRDGDADSVLAMLQLAANPRDPGSFRRAASTSRRAPRLLDSKAAQAVYSTARTQGCDLISAAETRLSGYRDGSRAHRDLEHATEASRILQRMISDRNTTIQELCQVAWRLLRVGQGVSPGEPADPQTRLLFRWAREHDSAPGTLPERLPWFLYTMNPDVNRDQLPLERNDPLDSGRGMTFSTIEAAAGLEWGTVFLVNTTEDVFPGKPGQGGGERVLRAHRRIYQASTRARDELRYYYPVISGETWHAEPSSLLEGLEDHLLERIWIGPRDPW